MSPFYKQDKLSGEHMALPCGKCPECLKRRVSAWSYRLVKQGQAARSAHFVTLTYDTHHVPITKKGWMNLCKRDLQLFFKRLRKNTKIKDIKYYAVGEYGGKSYRPHYHLILFNTEPHQVEQAWVDNNGYAIGQCHFGTVAEASIGYTLKYVCKPSRVPLHKNDDRQPEFALMSKKLGMNYLIEQMINYHKNDLEKRMFIPLQDGKKIAMPRYYKDKIYNEQERKKISKFIQQKVEKENDLNHKKYGDDYEKHLVESYRHKFETYYKNQRLSETL